MLNKLKNWLFKKPAKPDESQVFGCVVRHVKARPWIKNNGQMPVTQGAFVDVMFENTAIEKKRPAATYDWTRNGNLGPYEIAYWRLSASGAKAE